MGLWSQLIGADNFAAAQNAVLMEHALSVMSDAERSALMQQLPTTAMSGAPPHLSRDYVLSRFSEEGRLAQLNILALAMADLGQRPRLAKELWMSIRNPFICAANTDANWAKVRTAEADILRRHRVDVRVPRTTIW